MDIKDLVHLRLVNKHLYTLFKHSGFSMTLKRFQLHKDVVFKDGMFSGTIYKEILDNNHEDLYNNYDDTSGEDDFLSTYSRKIILKPKPAFSKKRKSYYPYYVRRISNKHYTELIHLHNNTNEIDFSDYIDFKRTEEYIEKIFDPQSNNSTPLFNFRRTIELKGVIDLTYIIYSNLCIINDLDDSETKDRKLTTLLQLVCSCDNKIQLPQLPRFTIECVCSYGIRTYGHNPNCCFWRSEYIKTCDKCSKAHIPYVHFALDVFSCKHFFTDVKYWECNSNYWKIN